MDKKQRHNPDKPQNNYGGDYECINYDTYHDGTEFCHDEQSAGWGEFIKWSQTKDGKLKCKGNRHNCLKLRQQWLASLPKHKRDLIL
jgi:hypothetical protein